ncbi:hypothetical protein AAMO2058_000265400 [Amorphochlora amoebiformis]
MSTNKRRKPANTVLSKKRHSRRYFGGFFLVWNQKRVEMKGSEVWKCEYQYQRIPGIWVCWRMSKDRKTNLTGEAKKFWDKFQKPEVKVEVFYKHLCKEFLGKEPEDEKIKRFYGRIGKLAGYCHKENNCPDEWKVSEKTFYRLVRRFGDPFKDLVKNVKEALFKKRAGEYFVVPWYHGSIADNEVEEEFQSAKANAFIVREMTKINWRCLTVEKSRYQIVDRKRVITIAKPVLFWEPEDKHWTWTPDNTDVPVFFTTLKEAVQGIVGNPRWNERRNPICTKFNDKMYKRLAMIESKPGQASETGPKSSKSRPKIFGIF